ncbi:hypothetical protein MMC07_001993 [Pseudocyphellaria aurata]|nr:hypothetical protein [Pseudocyphellaria aurata]
MAPLMAPSLFAYASLRFGWSQGMRRELGDLQGYSPPLDHSTDTITPLDEPVFPSLAYLPQKDSSVDPMDQGSVNQLKTESTLADLVDMSPSIDPTTKTASENSLITSNIRQSFLRIKHGECQYGLYALSQDKSQLLFKECGKSSYWGDLRTSISRSEPGFALVTVGNGGLLSIRNLYNEKSQYDAVVLLTSEDPWLNALKPVFGGVIAIGYVFDESSLAALIDHFYGTRLPGPGSWYMNSP